MSVQSIKTLARTQELVKCRSNGFQGLKNFNCQGVITKRNRSLKRHIVSCPKGLTKTKKYYMLKSDSVKSGSVGAGFNRASNFQFVLSWMTEFIR